MEVSLWNSNYFIRKIQSLKYDFEAKEDDYRDEIKKILNSFDENNLELERNKRERKNVSKSFFDLDKKV